MRSKRFAQQFISSLHSSTIRNNLLALAGLGADFERRRAILEYLPLWWEGWQQLQWFFWSQFKSKNNETFRPHTFKTRIKEEKVIFSILWGEHFWLRKQMSKQNTENYIKEQYSRKAVQSFYTLDLEKLTEVIKYCIKHGFDTSPPPKKEEPPAKKVPAPQKQ